MSQSPVEIKPAAPPRDFPAPQPPLMAVLLMVGVWWSAIVGHFLVCGLCAYMLGDPTELPFWLKPWDELFQYGISGILGLLLIAVWWLVVLVAAAPLVFVCVMVGRVLHVLFTPRGVNDDHDASAMQALGALGPTAIMALLSLLILPMQAPNHIDSESGLELANQVSYAAFVENQFLSLFAMFVILILFGVLFGGASVMAAYDLGMFAFFMLILLSIGVAITTGMLLGPEVGEWPQRYGAYQATALAFAGLAVLTGLPMFLMLRAGK